MKRGILSLVSICISLLIFCAYADDNHQLSNSSVKIPALEYKNSRAVENKRISGKNYIGGKSSSYNKQGVATAGKALMPYASYDIAAKLAGGTYTVTVYYSIDKDKAPNNPYIYLEMDFLGDQKINVDKKNLVNSVKASFNTKILKDKKHSVKIWLPCQGVRIEKFEVRRAIISKK